LLLGAAEWTLRAVGYGHTTKPFIMRQVNGHDYASVNMAFFEQFLPMWPDRIGSEPYDVVIPVEKGPRTFRVAILGGSASYGHPHPAFGFGRHLEVMLRSQCPDMSVEVHCLGWNGMNSHVMRYIARAARRLDFDLFLVYMGNNEVKGTLSPLMYDMHHRFPKYLLVEIYAFVSDLRSFQFGCRALGRIPGFVKNPQEWASETGILGVTDPRLQRVYRDYRENVEAICDTALEADAAVALCTVATNLRTWRPGGSENRPGMDASAREQWNTLYAAGRAAEESGDCVNASECYRKALAIDDGHADLNFRAATCLLALGAYEDARPRFVRALEMDNTLIRANSRINGVLREVAERRHGQRVYFIDTAKRMEELSPHGIPGDEFFVDNVHFSFDGNWRLAGAVFEALRDRLPSGFCPQAQGGTEAPPLETCASWLAATPYDRLQMVQGTIRDYEALDPSHPLDLFRQIEAALDAEVAGQDRTEVELAACRRAAELNQADFVVRSRYVNALGPVDGEAEARALMEAFPYLWRSRALLACVLDRLGKRDEAEEVYRHQLDLFNDLAETHLVWGRMLLERNRFAEALAAFRKSASMKRYNEHARFGEGRALMGLGDWAGAAAAFEAAIALEPRMPEVHEWLAEALRKSLDAEARVDRWRALCTTYPDLAETHVFLAQALEDAGRADEAFEHYGQAQALSPGAGLVRALCALALARAGRVDEARPMLERSLEPIGDRPNLRAEITGVLEELGAGAAATEE